MAVQPERSTEDTKLLRRCINDLVSVLALPAMWTGGSPPQIVGNLLDALMSMLGLDFIYARLRDSSEVGYTEMMRVEPTSIPKLDLSSEELKSVGALLGQANQLHDSVEDSPEMILVGVASYRMIRGIGAPGAPTVMVTVAVCVGTPAAVAVKV